MIDELTMSHNLLYLTQTCEAGRNGHFLFLYTTMSSGIDLADISYLSSGSKECIYSINPARLATV